MSVYVNSSPSEMPTERLELMQVSEFRRWRYHAPDSLKRQADEIIRQLVRQAAPPAAPGRLWTHRVGKK